MQWHYYYWGSNLSFVWAWRYREGSTFLCKLKDKENESCISVATLLYFLLVIVREIITPDLLELQISQLYKVVGLYWAKSIAESHVFNFVPFVFSWSGIQASVVSLKLCSKEIWPSLETYTLKVSALILNNKKRADYKKIAIKHKYIRKVEQKHQWQQKITNVLPLGPPCWLIELLPLIWKDCSK